MAIAGENEMSKKRRADFLRFWLDKSQALTTQEIEVMFKVEGRYFPPTRQAGGSPYLCELAARRMLFYALNPQSSTWKNSLTKMISFNASDLVSVTLSTRKVDHQVGQQVGKRAGLQGDRKECHQAAPKVGPQDRDVLPVQTVWLAVQIKFATGDCYRLTSKSILVAAEILKWCAHHGVAVVDAEKMGAIFAHAENPVDAVCEQCLEK